MSGESQCEHDHHHHHFPRRRHPMSIETLAAQLRTLRARIDAQTANQHSWPTKEEELAADVDRYDRRLLKAAAMLQVDAPSARHREQFLLSERDRTTLERALAEAGLDVRAPAEEREP
jgi:aminoglycoside phosphotransferase (APT) family kinase protein